jgi:hypothetical protein
LTSSIGTQATEMSLFLRNIHNTFSDKHVISLMYQHNDRLTQLLAKYKYVWLWLQCFDPYLGHRQAYVMNLESVVHV